MTSLNTGMTTGLTTSIREQGRKWALAVGLAAASTLTFVAPAQAHDGYDRGNDVAVAVGAGLIGLAVGAAIADRHDRYYYDRRYYGSRHYVTVRGRPGYYYYYEGRPNRYYQDRYYSRYYAPYYRERYARPNAWRGDPRHYDRRDYRGHDDRRHYDHGGDHGHDRGHERGRGHR